MNTNPSRFPALQRLYERNMQLFARAGVEYQEYQHEPVFSYDTARLIIERFRLTGAESKSLFLKGKNGSYAMYVTVQGARANFKIASSILGTRVSVAKDEELTARTGCLPQCACPFGHDAQVTLLIDPVFIEVDTVLFSPGPPERTIEMRGSDVKRVLDVCENRVVCVPRDLS